MLAYPLDYLHIIQKLNAMLGLESLDQAIQLVEGKKPHTEIKNHCGLKGISGYQLSDGWQGEG